MIDKGTRIGLGGYAMYQVETSIEKMVTLVEEALKVPKLFEISLSNDEYVWVNPIQVKTLSRWMVPEPRSGPQRLQITPLRDLRDDRM